MKKHKTILIVDDESSMRKNLSDILTLEGYSTLEAEEGLSGLDTVRSKNVDLVLLDLNMPGMDGISVLREVKAFNEDIPVIMLTAYGTNEKVIESIKAGAYDYVEKPFELPELLLIIERALKYLELVKEVKALRSRVSETELEVSDEKIVGRSQRMREIMKLIGLAAPSEATVLIQGESGTGKEMIADAIKRHSSRKDKPYIKVNCGALSESLLESEIFGHEKGSFTGAISKKLGRFELANTGTIFLDEINNMPHSIQVKLLRILQHQSFYRVGGETPVPVDIRIIAATNRDAEEEVKQGRLRKDLYYRLNVVRINLPSLNERKEDLPLLVDHFLKKYKAGKDIVVSEELIRKLQSYHWPGNVRELENLIQRSIITSRDNVLTIDDSFFDKEEETGKVIKPLPGKNGKSLRHMLSEYEKSIINDALNETDWNQTKAAHKLKINRRLLYSKIREYNLVNPKQDKK